ncbi:MAG: ATP synthase F1 subunit gamma [Pseudomonadales bacterium]|nr:ATP synthase F1 subunit gamma [Pseudomonadales bacterium]
MNNARQIKQRIKTANNIAKITKAMEMVSASKMKKAQESALAARPYALTLANSLKLLQSQVVEYIHPLLEQHSDGADVLVLVSTDRGLCGSLNPNLFKHALQWYNTHQQPTIIAVGKKAVAFTRTYGLTTKAEFTDLGDSVELTDILPIATAVTQGFVDGEYRSVTALFMDFINTLRQEVAQTQILPLTIDDPDERTLAQPIEASEFLFEPSAQYILDELLPYYLETSLLHAFLEAKASEHSARMVAMKNASDNAGELVDDLKLAYNKSRQASITSELLDITTSVLSQQ